MSDVDLDLLEIEVLALAIKHGKHDQRSHGRRTARRQAYGAAYQSARAAGASPAEARSRAKGISAEGEQDRLQAQTKDVAHNPSLEAQQTLARILSEPSEEEKQALSALAMNRLRVTKEYEAAQNEMYRLQSFRKLSAEDKKRKAELEKQMKALAQEERVVSGQMEALEGRRSVIEVDKPAAIGWDARDWDVNRVPRDSEMFGAKTLLREQRTVVDASVKDVSRLTKVPPARAVDIGSFGVDSQRPFFADDFDGIGIMLGKTIKPVDVVHEMGHAIEDTNPEINRKARAFLEARTRGETAQSLARLTNKQYGIDEVSKPDRFPDPYVGKIYDDKGKGISTEVISMGLEYLYTDARRFAQQDPEYFMFMYDTLRGK